MHLAAGLMEPNLQAFNERSLHERYKEEATLGSDAPGGRADGTKLGGSGGVCPDEAVGG